MSAKASRPPTLQQRIEQMVAQHQLWFDPIDSPEQHLHCSFCESAILIDYFQFGVMDMNRRLMSFASEHGKCTPRLATKVKDMVLTPVEGKHD
jgi:hypothetical protein